RLHEAEVLEHRMAAEVELADHARAFRPRGDARERDALVHRVALDAGETPKEVEVPPRAAEFAVGDRLKADLLLLLDDLPDLAVLDRLGIGSRHPPLPPLRPARDLRPRLLDRRGAHQAADVIGAKRRLDALHGVPSPSSWPGIAVRRTASLRSPMPRPRCLLRELKEVDARDKRGHDGTPSG